MRMAHKIKRGHAYRSAVDSMVPGYLAQRFKAMLADQRRAERERAASEMEAAQKVRAMPKRRAG